MISRVSSGFVDNIGRRSSELCPLALEANVRNASYILVAISKVVSKEKNQLLHFAEQCPLNRNLLEIACLRELEGLHGV